MCGIAFAQEANNTHSEKKDELFAKYLSDSLNAPQKIKEILGLLQSNKSSDKTESLEEYEVAFSLAPYVGDSAYILTPLYAQFSGLLDNVGAREMAIEYAKKALAYRQKGSLKQPGFEYNLIGRIAGFYVRSKQYDTAMYYYKMAENVAITAKDILYTSSSQNNIGLLYMKEGMFDSAFNSFQRALVLLNPMVKRADSVFKGAILDNLAENYFADREYQKSINAYNTKIDWSKIIHSSTGVIVSQIGISKCLVELHNYQLALNYLTQAETGLTKEPIQGTRGISLNLLEAKGFYDSAAGDWKGALQVKNALARIKDSIVNEQKKSTDGLIRTLTEMQILKARRDIQYFQLQQMQKETVLKEQQRRKEQRFSIIRNVLILGLILCLAFAVIFFMQRIRISKEKKRSEELLLNILPAETANELKSNGSIRAKDYLMVTVLFTDFINFTKSSETMSAQDLVNEIHYCYSEFDRIIALHGIEKIKTIGDGYMAAGGLPIENNTNPFDAVNAALEIRNFMELEQRKRSIDGKPFFEMRIGLHTGPVVAGIVGIKKFAYDIWGDTVNIAARMEAGGEAGKVNISGATYELIKDKFNCTYRGKVQAKNKGEIDMYFVEG